jgi:hypothetical protein
MGDRRFLWERTSKGSQMDIKRKTYDIWSWEKHLFLDISSTDIDTPVPSLYQRVETVTITVFWLLSQPLPHLRFNFFVISETFVTQLWSALRNKHLSPKIGNISLIISLYWVLLLTKNRTAERCSSLVHSSSTFAILSIETSLLTCSCASAT